MCFCPCSIGFLERWEEQNDEDENHYSNRHGFVVFRSRCSRAESAQHNGTNVFVPRAIKPRRLGKEVRTHLESSSEESWAK